MITPELVAFIKTEIAKGKTKEQIQSELLLGGGWKSEDIDEAFKNIENPTTPIAIPELISTNNNKLSLLRILTLIIIGGISGLFYKGYIFVLLKITPVHEINNITSEFITQFLSLTSFGFALVLALFIFYRKQSNLNIWKGFTLVVGAGIAFSAAIQLVWLFTLGNLFDEDSSGMFFVLIFGLAGILGGGLMLLFVRAVIGFSILSFIVLTLVSGIIGAIFGFINDPTFFLPSTWQAAMLVGIIAVSHKFLVLNQNSKASSKMIKILSMLLIASLIFGSVNFMNSQKEKREEKLVHVQADLKRDGSSVIRNLESLKQSFDFFKKGYFIGYGSVSNSGSCSNPAEGSIFNIGNKFQPKEIIEKDTISYQSQVQQLFIDIKKYTTNERSFPFNHMQETQCFSNQEHFAYLVPSFYEKDFPKFYCVDDVYGDVQVRYSKIKGPSCDDLDPNYVAPKERLIPDKPYYVYHKVTGLPEYENVVLESRDIDTENVVEESVIEPQEIKPEIIKEIQVLVENKPLPIKQTPVVSKPVVSNNTLKPYEIRFISPPDGTKVQLGDMLSVKVQVGEKIKKVRVNNISYFYNPTDSPHSGIKPFEVPVEGGYANYSSRIDGTLAPINFYLEGITDDPVAYFEAESKLTQDEVSKMYLEIKPFTNQPIEYFALEDKNEEVNYLYYKSEKHWVPQFIAGFPVHGIVAVALDGVEYVISDPTVLKIVQDPLGPRHFVGLKNGSTKVIAKYKGMSQEIFYIVEPSYFGEN